jgi:hypothetical protein
MNDLFPHSISLIMGFAGALGFGILSYRQKKDRPSSKKWMLLAAVSLIFFVSAVLDAFGINFL